VLKRNDLKDFKVTLKKTKLGYWKASVLVPNKFWGGPLVHLDGLAKETDADGRPRWGRRVRARVQSGGRQG
jgi:hypothetical protein